jgi:H+/gluconate symporter-like permease
VHNLIFLEIWELLCGFPLVIVSIYHSIFTIMLGTLLPLLIMIICAVLIRFNLASKRERRQYNIGQQNKQQAVRLLHARDHQALVMLFVQAICFCLSALPWTTYLLYNSFTRTVTNKSTDRIAIELFLRYLTEITTYIYPTLSFYIYTLTSYTFRRQLIKTMQLILNYRNRRAVHPRRIIPNIENT